MRINFYCTILGFLFFINCLFIFNDQSLIVIKVNGLVFYKQELTFRSGILASEAINYFFPQKPLADLKIKMRFLGKWKIITHFEKIYENTTLFVF